MEDTRTIDSVDFIHEEYPSEVRRRPFSYLYPTITSPPPVPGQSRPRDTAVGMSDFNPAPYKGDPSIPHADEGAFEVRPRGDDTRPPTRPARPAPPVWLTAATPPPLFAQLVLVGMMGALGLHYLRNVVSVRPMWT